MPTADERLRQASQYLKSGEKVSAKPIIASVLKEDPYNAQAWYLAAYIYDDDDKRIQALEKALSIDPQHTGAQKALNKLRPVDELDSMINALPPSRNSGQRGNHGTVVYVNQPDNPMVTAARMKSYTGAAVGIFVLYWLMWLPGVIVNLIYYNDLKRNEQLAGYSLPGGGAIRFMWVLFGFIPIALFIVYLVLLIIF